MKARGKEDILNDLVPDGMMKTAQDYQHAVRNLANDTQFRGAVVSFLEGAIQSGAFDEILGGLSQDDQWNAIQEALVQYVQGSRY